MKITIDIKPLETGIEPPWDLLLEADESREHLEDCLKRGRCFVATIEDGIVGVVVLMATRALTAEITQVAVREDLRGRGIGKALLGWAIKEASEGPYRSLDICTGNCGIGQLALYQKCGFRIVGVDIDHIAREYADPIEENGIPCRDMIRLSMVLKDKEGGREPDMVL